MAGMQGFEVKVPEVFSRVPEPFRLWGEEMHAADDTSNPALPADLPGILRNIADPCMRTAGNDDQSVTGTIRECGIVPQRVGFRPAIGQDDPPFPRICLFERELPGDLSQKDTILRDPHRFVGEVERELASHFRLPEDRAVIPERESFLSGKNSGCAQ